MTQNNNDNLKFRRQRFVVIVIIITISIKVYVIITLSSSCNSEWRSGRLYWLQKVGMRVCTRTHVYANT